VASRVSAQESPGRQAEQPHLCCPIADCNGITFNSHSQLLHHFHSQTEGHQLKVTHRLNTGRRIVVTVFYRQPRDFCFSCPCDNFKRRFSSEEELRDHLYSLPGSDAAATHGTNVYTKPTAPSSMTNRAYRQYFKSGVLVQLQ
jgi:hypothetical protein